MCARGGERPRGTSPWDKLGLMPSKDSQVPPTDSVASFLRFGQTWILSRVPTPLPFHDDTAVPAR